MKQKVYLLYKSLVLAVLYVAYVRRVLLYVYRGVLYVYSPPCTLLLLMLSASIPNFWHSAHFYLFTSGTQHTSISLLLALSTLISPYFWDSTIISHTSDTELTSILYFWHPAHFYPLPETLGTLPVDAVISGQPDTFAQEI